ncbi:hypothetical protein [Pantoea agglomerans]|uniref:hypothetical protein n=1 Tax=Enterobacter agglomerans TaxID=549 RepID=UPI0010097D75|nr:hypothetical protein [Pantoea agglomerans]QAV47621.1 hypothetical protein D1629_23735 [Pantoea agglomerans]QAV52175.1 hypothetical protein D1628_23065 [Pantoea agglomerans]
MHTQNINTAASESSKTWVNGPNKTADDLVFVRIDTGKVFSQAIRMNDGSIVSLFNFETLDELQMQYDDMALMTESEADALFCTRLFRPWEEITEERWMDQLTVLPPLDWKSSPAGETFKCCEMYSGKVTHIFAHIRGRYFECRDYAWKKHADLVLSAVLAMAAENAH